MTVVGLFDRASSADPFPSPTRGSGRPSSSLIARVPASCSGDSRCCQSEGTVRRDDHRHGLRVQAGEPTVTNAVDSHMRDHTFNELAVLTTDVGDGAW